MRFSTVCWRVNLNRTRFVANKIGSNDNNGPLDLETQHAGGVVIRGAHTLQPNLASDNQVEIVLTDCKVNGNQAPGDVIAHGAHCSNPAGVAGKNNKTTISLQGHNNFTVHATDSELWVQVSAEITKPADFLLF